MNLSTKQLAQVISPYIGQDMITTTRAYEGEGKPSKYLKGKFLEIDLGMVDSFIGVLLENETEPSNHTNYNINEVKLILKPLTKITDEDLLGLIPEDKKWNNGKIWKIQTVCYYTAFDEKGNKVGEDMWILNPSRPETIKNPLHYQYLQSKGYDLPNYFLRGKTLKESGLATYENEQS